MIEATPEPAPGSHYAMTLYVAGATHRSLTAVANLRTFLEQELSGRYDLEVVDLYRAPGRAKAADVVVAPTLVRYDPTPPRRVIGDMSDRQRLRAAIKVD